MNLKNYPITALLLKRYPKIFNVVVTGQDEGSSETSPPVSEPDDTGDEEQIDTINEFNQLDALFGADD